MPFRSTEFSRLNGDLKNQEHIRSLAVCMVDGQAGYTMEFAPSPVAHREAYNEMERRLRAAMQLNRVRLSRLPDAQ